MTYNILFIHISLLLLFLILLSVHELISFVYNLYIAFVFKHFISIPIYLYHIFVWQS